MNVFLERYKKLGHKFNPELIELKKSIRVNTLKIDVGKLVLRLQQKGVQLTAIPFTDHGYYVEGDFSLGSTNEYLQGYYYLQEAASQVAVKVLDPQPGEVVLDMCAAPGGKTTQISQAMNNEGKVVAIDVNRKRLVALRNNIDRMGATNVVVYQLNALDIDELGEMFDRILLDAPCSGNCMIDDKWFVKRDMDGILENAQMQKELVERALRVLKPGGVLVYSTCSLEPEEDEDVVSWAKKRFDISVEEEKKFWPDTDGTQGFFVAKLIKK